MARLARLSVSGLLHSVLTAMAVVLGSQAAPQVAQACPGADPCAVDGGRYYARVPDGWDGTSPLPTALYFHGWQGTGAGVMGNAPRTAAFTDRGILLIAPDGAERSWSHQGSPTRARDEHVFLSTVLDDVQARWPVDPDRLWATGFSQGGSMVWDLACFLGDRFAAFVPVAGGFWRPMPERCPSGPVALMHIHGLSDGVVPLEGRGIRNDTWHQGDIFGGMETLRAANGCRANPSAFQTVTVGEATLHCRTWDASVCESGVPLRLCLHAGGHSYPPEWTDLGWDWVRAVAGEGAGAASPAEAGSPTQGRAGAD